MHPRSDSTEFRGIGRGSSDSKLNIDIMHGHINNQMATSTLVSPLVPGIT